MNKNYLGKKVKYWGDQMGTIVGCSDNFQSKYITINSCLIGDNKGVSLGDYLKFMGNYLVVDNISEYFNLHGEDWYILNDEYEFEILKKFYPNTSLFRRLYPNGELVGNFWRVDA